MTRPTGESLNTVVSTRFTSRGELSLWEQCRKYGTVGYGHKGGWLKADIEFECSAAMGPHITCSHPGSGFNGAVCSLETAGIHVKRVHYGSFG